MFKFIQKLKDKKELNRRSENTMLYSHAGLINNPNFCIKGQTTCACVCKSCMEEMGERIKDLLTIKE